MKSWPRLAFITLLSLPAGAVAALDDATGAWRETCAHYDNRARFLPRTPEPAFPALLADGCAAALQASPDVASGAEAIRFLDRLSAARAEIAAINMQRFQRALSAPKRARRETFGLVTETGEYLILMMAGVFDALGAWVDAGGDFDRYAQAHARTDD